MSPNERKLERCLYEAIKALQMYGHPDSYYAISFLFDPPCGEFRDDFARVDKGFGYERKMPGKLARRTLNKIAKRLESGAKPGPGHPDAEKTQATAS